LKPLIKYPVTFFLLLLIGYSQLFAYLYRGFTFIPFKNGKDLKQDQVYLINKASEIEDIYIEEEEEEANERNSFRKFLGEGNCSILFIFDQLSHHFLCSCRGGVAYFNHFTKLFSFKSLNIAISLFRI
jgi:hypothetical protein